MANLYFVPLIIIHVFRFVKQDIGSRRRSVLWYTPFGDEMKKVCVLLAIFVFLGISCARNAKEEMATTEKMQSIAVEKETRECTAEETCAQTRETKIKEAVRPIVEKYLTYTSSDLSFYLHAVDWEEGVTYNVHAMDPASVIKIFVLARVTELVKEGEVSRNETRVMDYHNIACGSGNLQYEAYGSAFTVGELVREMMRRSDNTATNLLIDVVGGVDEMNRSIARWGMKDTLYGSKFQGPNVELGPGYNKTTVSDVGDFLRRIAGKKFLGKHWDESIIEEMTHTENDSKIAALLPKGISIAHKTGELDGLEHDAAILTTQLDTYILVFFMDQGSNDDFIKRIRTCSKEVMTKILEIERADEK